MMAYWIFYLWLMKDVCCSCIAILIWFSIHSLSSSGEAQRLEVNASAVPTRLRIVRRSPSLDTVPPPFWSNAVTHHVPTTLLPLEELFACLQVFGQAFFIAPSILSLSPLPTFISSQTWNAEAMNQNLTWLKRWHAYLKTSALLTFWFPASLQVLLQSRELNYGHKFEESYPIDKFIYIFVWIFTTFIFLKHTGFLISKK